MGLRKQALYWWSLVTASHGALQIFGESGSILSENHYARSGVTGIHDLVSRLHPVQSSKCERRHGVFLATP